MKLPTLKTSLSWLACALAAGISVTPVARAAEVTELKDDTGKTIIRYVAEPPEGIHPNAGGPLPTPAGSTTAAVALGSRIFHGEVANAPCAGCHGTNAMGSPLGPNLTGKWLWGDGSLPSITKIITDGVPNPKNYRSPMPPMGGAQLTPSQVSAVAAYVWALNHRSRG